MHQIKLPSAAGQHSKAMFDEFLFYLFKGRNGSDPSTPSSQWGFPRYCPHTYWRRGKYRCHWLQRRNPFAKGNCVLSRQQNTCLLTGDNILGDDRSRKVQQINTITGMNRTLWIHTPEIRVMPKYYFINILLQLLLNDKPKILSSKNHYRKLYPSSDQMLELHSKKEEKSK